MKYLDDIKPGDSAAFGNYPVTREEVLDFASKYDPQPFHLDDAEAAKTYFGRLSASGWHTCAMTMRMIVDGNAAGGTAGLGSPGVDQIRWKKPVYPGDTLRVESVVTEVRPSRSKPDIGSVHSDITVFNQDNDPVMTMSSTVLVRRRPV